MNTVELYTIINDLTHVRENAKLPRYLEEEQAKSIYKLKAFLISLNIGELEIVNPLIKKYESTKE